MRNPAFPALKSLPSRLAVLAVVGAGLSGCSSDLTRFGGGDFTGNTANQQSILGTRRAAPQPYPGDVVATMPPPAPSVHQTALPPVGGAGQAGYAPLAAPLVTGSLPAASGSWVTLMPGETVDTLATRYGMPASTILQANKLASGGQILPGQKVLIPSFDMQQQMARMAAPAPAAPQYVPPAAPVVPARMVAPAAPHYVPPAAPARLATPAPVPAAPHVAAAPKLVPVAAPAPQRVGSIPAAAPKVAVAPQPMPAPVQKVASIAPVAPARALPAETAQPGVNIGPHVVKKGETLDAIARLYGTSKSKLVAVNGLKSETLVAGQRLTLPSGVMLKVAKAPQPAPAPAAPPAPLVAKAATPAPLVAPTPVAPAAAPAAVADSTQVGSIKESAAVAREPGPEAGALRAEKGPSFRWPVRGRVIGEFGTKNGADRNDGINLAVPEGTSIKASEDGEVIHAGNELKGYGNLVLIKHADGWISAYAHASKLMVNKGDKVTRGQIIAAAGTTGNVQQPQLHFELRKGQKPVDPTQYLVN